MKIRSLRRAGAGAGMMILAAIAGFTLPARAEDGPVSKTADYVEGSVSGAAEEGVGGTAQSIGDLIDATANTVKVLIALPFRMVGSAATGGKTTEKRRAEEAAKKDPEKAASQAAAAAEKTEESGGNIFSRAVGFLGGSAVGVTKETSGAGKESALQVYAAGKALFTAVVLTPLRMVSSVATGGKSTAKRKESEAREKETNALDEVKEKK